MRAEGFPFKEPDEACKCGASGQPPVNPPIKYDLRKVGLMAAGMAGGCAVGYQIAVNRGYDPFVGCLVGSAGGGLVGLAAGKLIWGFNFALLHPASWVGRQPQQKGGFRASITLRF
jgi:hypothetical protein